MRAPVSYSTVQQAYILTLTLVLAPVLAAAPAKKPTAGADHLALQVALDRAGFSPGELDGQAGPKTRLALVAYKAARNADPALPPEPITSYTITPADAAGPFIDTMPHDMMAAAGLTAFGYTSALEALAEKFHSSPALLRKLNPGASWDAGAVIKVPDVEPFALPDGKPVKAAPGIAVFIDGATHSLTVRDAAGTTLMHAPVTIGSEKDPLPVGGWKVVGVSWNPVFNYNPDLFWDADPTHAKAKIPAGPNNPVGVVWVDINKEHFGLHGSPEPSTVGRTESHGCIRLTNWDATKLGRLVSVGTAVSIQ
jgi:lipoprotein-anchoring transpeptidase ErfK/SrfK